MYEIFWDSPQNTYTMSIYVHSEIEANWKVAQLKAEGYKAWYEALND